MPEPLLLSAAGFACKMSQGVAGFCKWKPPKQKDPVLARFKETVFLGTEDSSFSFPIKKLDDKYLLGTQGSGGALIWSHTNH